MKLTTTNFIQVSVFFILCGSFFYIGFPAFSISFLLILISVLMIIKMKKIVYKVDFFSILTFAYLCILGLIAIIINPSYENLQYLKSFFTIFIMFMFFLCSRNLNIDLKISIFLFTFFIFIFAFLQFTYLNYGFGVNPAIQAMEGYDVNLNTYGVRSIFGNSNDFSVVLILLSIYYFLNKNVKILILCGLLIFFAGSRTVMLLYFILMASFYLREINFKKIISFIFLVTFSFLFFFFYLKSNIDLYSVRRFMNIFDGLNNDGSIQSRFYNIGVFWENILNLSFGGWSAKNYNIYVDPIFYVNPHSFIIEIILLYGFYGFVFLISFFLISLIYLSKLNNVSKMEKILFGFILLMITFVPSSILNFPTFWALIFIILLTQNNRETINV